MAECMDEFDEATPLRETYCSRLTAAEYQEQAASCTEGALRELMNQLDSRPELYKSVLQKRRREEKEEAGLVSFLKVRLWSLMGMEDTSCSVSDLECQEELHTLKASIMKAHTYSQESKGRRYSLRLAKKRKSASSTPVRGGKIRARNIPPPPPPPPPPPIPVATTSVSIPFVSLPNHRVFHGQLPPPQKRRPLGERNSVTERRLRKHPPRGGMEGVLGQLNGSGCRKKLRTTAAKSPGGTPLTGWGAHEPLTPEGVRQFNQLLINKFRNVKTPPSPYRCQQASPGTFESPL